MTAARAAREWLVPRTPMLGDLVRRPGVRLAFLTVLVAMVGLRGLLIPGGRWAVLSWMTLLGGWAVVMLLVTTAAWPGRRNLPSDMTPKGPTTMAHWGLLLLVLLVAASPYLGLRTQSSFTMFSNLRTEEADSNHLVVGSIDPLGWQSGYVRIEATTDPRLEVAMEHDELVHPLELRRRLADDPDQAIAFVADGERVELERAADRPDLAQVGFWEGKLLRFRPMAADGVPRCQH